MAAPADTPADTPPADTPPVATAPPEPIPAPVTETAALPPAPAAAAPRKPAPAPARAAEKPRPAVRPPATAKPRGENGKDTRVAVAAPSAGASGLGIGRSDAHSNYPGLVAAHLARFKRFPAEARQQGNGGVATVRFMLDGGGRVTSVALVAGSGNPALDRESVEVVRRASPFPAPPDGRPRGFSQPIRFNVR
ncbi:hypothetical protein CH341_08965 [Rhodoplanes roseus]|uniref:TonB C-terminal domain-containing protein n=1 Tax=Rhodoplanes roseus TaxID=29409 RepID=A0A327L9P6_9BRAD|nr:hypothetical protein CH341_08965 [Rhodoplanes roseus]